MEVDVSVSWSLGCWTLSRPAVATPTAVGILVDIRSMSASSHVPARAGMPLPSSPHAFPSSQTRTAFAFVRHPRTLPMCNSISATRVHRMIGPASVMARVIIAPPTPDPFQLASFDTASSPFPCLRLCETGIPCCFVPTPAGRTTPASCHSNSSLLPSPPSPSSLWRRLHTARPGGV